MYTLNKFQRLAARTYSNGELYPRKSSWPDYDAFKADYLDHQGDTLFRFIMIELSTSEGCYSALDAQSRMERAHTDLGGIVDEMLDLEDPEVPDDTPCLDTSFHDHEMNV